MRNMKKIVTILSTCMLSLFSFTFVYGQDIAAAIETYNAGATALASNNYVAAIESFNKAIKMFEAISELDEDGASAFKQCKEILPQIHLRYGKELAVNKNFDNALAQLDKAIETAKKYNNPDVEKEANELIPQLVMAGADDNLNLGLFNEAIAGYNKMLTYTPNDPDVYLRLGIAQSKLNNEDAAIAAYLRAIELGDKQDAPKMLSNIYLKKAAAAFSDKNNSEALAMAKKANQYYETVQGNQIIGLSAMQLKKYDDAIPALEAYIAQSNDSKNKNAIIYNIAAAYEAKGNIAKACGYYKQIVSDPKFKAAVEYKINTVLKCK